MKEKNVVYTGANGRQSVYDIDIPENWNGTLVLFLHGYMGYKDWGCWNLTGNFFTDNCFGFVSYNVSHNGGTIEQPIDFPDLEAFAMNSYSNELIDFECMVKTLELRLEKFQLYVIGHSRGGGIAALQSAHPSVDKWVSWAGISSIAKRFPEGKELDEWRKNTFRYVKNGRTNQLMPHHFNQYLDFLENKNRLDIERYCRNNTKPCLIIHGSDDTSVLPLEGELLSNWTGTQLKLIPNAQHTFNSRQPWHDHKMPDALEEVCHQTLLFFQS